MPPPTWRRVQSCCLIVTPELATGGPRAAAAMARSQSSPDAVARRARGGAVGSIPEQCAVEPRAVSVNELLRPVRKVRPWRRFKP